MYTCHMVETAAAYNATRSIYTRSKLKIKHTRKRKRTIVVQFCGMVRTLEVLRKFARFVGPGILVSVAYMDPGNYSTSVSGGAQFKYVLLSSVLISNLFAVVLQCLCVKLGTVTGRDLAENCRQHLPRKLNLTLYLFAQIAIIATDLAEVVGTAIALEILFGIPLSWGVLMTVLDVLAILMFYTPESSSLKKTRIFEMFVSLLVAGTVMCFVLELFKISVPDKGQLLKGFLPSKIIFKDQQALYISLGILGATVMPHSLYLGSSLVKPRLQDYDLKHHGAVGDRPSLGAIKYSLNYSYAELILSLFFIATFVNSAILIVAGATLFGQPDAEDADLLSIYHLLVQYITPAAGLIFAWAMIFSGQSAGIICTLAGQIVSEGFLEWSLPPWAIRLCTRLIAIVPCLFVTLTMGEHGISDILNLSQVVLSLILPIVSAPLIYFTASKKFMAVPKPEEERQESDENTALVNGKQDTVDFSNSNWLTILSVLIWAVIGILNCYLVISFLLGADVHF